MNMAVRRVPLTGPKQLLKQVSKVVTVPPPTGGWNDRDPLSEMEPEDAIVLDNIIPGTGMASLRLGFASWATGLGSYVESLMEYAPPSGTNQLFGAVPTAIYDVTSAGAVGAAKVSSLSNGRWQHTMFATSGGNYLVCANGADAVRNYDGSVWTSPSITNVTSANLIGVTAHVQRLWFVEKDKLDPWYLPVGAISGAAAKLTIGPFCKAGGYLAAIGSWSRDGGSGPDDMLVLATSKGEVLIYSGTDPSSATTFALVGTFRIAEPIGRRCLVKAGSDLGVLTKIGLVPLSQVLVNSVVTQEKTALTDKIRNAFVRSSATVGSSFGWQVFEHTKSRLIMVNVPVTERVMQYQYVVNADTGAWARFTGIDAGCWSLLGTTAFFGGNDGTVYQFGTDYLDDDTAVSAVVQQAYSNFGTSQYKHFKAARPLFVGPPGYAPAIEMKVNYDTSPVTLPTPVVPDSGSVWDEATWDVADWSGSVVPSATWQGLTGIGQVGSVAMAFSLTQAFTLNQTDVIFEVGGMF
jgi:hypothetical protein